MITRKKLKDRIDLTIDATVEVASAGQARQTLLDALALAAPERPARLDLSDDAAGAPALQLAIAARRSLEARGAFAGYGPKAAAQLPT